MSKFTVPFEKQNPAGSGGLLALAAFAKMLKPNPRTVLDMAPGPLPPGIKIVEQMPARLFARTVCGNSLLRKFGGAIAAGRINIALHALISHIHLP